MSRTALFLVIASGFLLSSFHRPTGQATFASTAPTQSLPRSISSEKAAVPADAKQSSEPAFNAEDPATVLN